MSQTVQQNVKPWVLTAVLKDNPSNFDPEFFVDKVKAQFDEWYSQGKFIWSGPLDDNKTSLTIFEATNSEAKKIFDDYKNIAGDIVDVELKQWEALPLLSLL